MGIFMTREAAEELILEDPFVLNGVVLKWHIPEWNEALWNPGAMKIKDVIPALS